MGRAGPVEGLPLQPVGPAVDPLTRQTTPAGFRAITPQSIATQAERENAFNNAVLAAAMPRAATGGGGLSLGALTGGGAVLGGLVPSLLDPNNLLGKLVRKAFGILSGDGTPTSETEEDAVETEEDALYRADQEFDRLELQTTEQLKEFKRLANLKEPGGIDLLRPLSSITPSIRTQDPIEERFINLSPEVAEQRRQVEQIASMLSPEAGEEMIRLNVDRALRDQLSTPLSTPLGAPGARLPELDYLGSFDPNIGDAITGFGRGLSLAPGWETSFDDLLDFL